MEVRGYPGLELRMLTIHETAVVHPKSVIGEDCEIGPYCVIGADVVMGPRNRISNHVTIMGDTTVGSDNQVFPHAVIGAPPQDLKYRGEKTRLEIGNHNQIREFVTVNTGTVQGGGLTRIGDRNMLMACCHVAHDCIVDDHVILANNSMLAGHIRVKSRAIVSGAAAVHHFTTIGRLAFVGAMTRVRQDVPPFMIVEGNPTRVRGPNVVGLRRAGVDTEGIEIIRQAYRFLYHSNISRREALDRIRSWDNRSPELEELLDFFGDLETSVKGRALEALRQA